MAEKHRRTADLWSGLALTALGAYIVSAAWQWEYLGSDGPGPGFFPMWYGVAMVVLSGFLVVSSALDKTGTGESESGIDWIRIRRALAAWLAFAVSVALFKLIGFVSSFALLTFFIVAVMYRRPVKVAAIVAAATAAGFYLVFSVALGVALPVGVLDF
jgi:putative tricarboxylic transport membrane protein